MRICLFSDVHGNMDAFDKMFSAERHNVDIFIFAGDIFGYFYSQKEIIEKMQIIDNLIAIRGNHDDYFLNVDDRRDLVERYGSSYELHLPKEMEKYLRELPNSRELELDSKKIGIFHGGPDDHLEQRIYPDIARSVQDNKYDFIIIGHTHYRFVQRNGSLTIINPGSLGQPRDGKGFSYSILDTKSEDVIFKTVPVDTEKLLAEVAEKDMGRKVQIYLSRKYGGI